MFSIRHQLSSYQVATLALICGLVSSLFFNGTYGIQLGNFALSVGMCLFWLLFPLLSQPKNTNIPLTALGLTLSLFWLWSGVSIFWSQAPLVSMLNFWWLGSLPIIYWGYMLHQDNEYLWRQCQLPLVLILMALVFIGLYQLFVLDERPHSIFLNPNSHAAFILLGSLPLTGYLLNLLSAQHVRKSSVITISILLWLCYFALAHSQSRGIILGFVLVLVLMYVLLRKDIAWRYFAILLALVISAYLIANISVSSDVAQRLQTLSNPASAGSDRFIIWQQSWEMLKNSPWIGIGLGMFWLLYPQYRDPSDSSGGLYVHNDYLQLWIETGLPGLILLLLTLFVTSTLLIRGIKSGQLTAHKKIEVVSMYTGMAAIALHSIFTFNFYVLPILILLGLMLARFHSLVMHATDVKTYSFNAERFITPATYRIILILVFLFPLGFLVSTGLASYYHIQGEQLAQEGQLQRADQALSRAHKLSPLSDIILFARADLYRQSISRLPVTSGAQRRELYNNAHDLLNASIRHNKLRPQPFYVRGRLYQDNPALAGHNWQQQAERAYAAALGLDPLFYKARYEYIRLLLSRGQNKQAFTLIEDGLDYHYPSHPDLVPFLGLCARLMVEHNNTVKGIELAQRVDQLLQEYGQNADFLDRLRQHYKLDLSGHEKTK